MSIPSAARSWISRRIAASRQSEAETTFPAYRDAVPAWHERGSGKLFVRSDAIHWHDLTMKRLVCVLLAASLSVGPVVQSVAAAPDPEIPAVGANVGADYIIGPGDALQVFVWRNAELTITVPVRPDGKISTPLVGDMVAVGKTPSMLARDIESVLAEYIRSPEVNIIVTQPNSVFSQVKVIGEVAQQQSMGYREGLTVLHVVLQAGGLTQFAAGNRAHILRTENGQQRKIPVRLKDLLNKGDLEYDLPMLPGDVLVVPQSRF